LIERPEGRLPLERAQVVKVPLPPEAERLAVYAEPTVPSGRLEVVTTGFAGARTVRVRDRAAVWVPAESVARTEDVLWPAAVGVPEMTPLVESSDRPVGRVPVDRAQAELGRGGVEVSVYMG
jgi:hypothetical protein